jgi:hypothetical protein
MFLHYCTKMSEACVAMIIRKESKRQRLNAPRSGGSSGSGSGGGGGAAVAIAEDSWEVEANFFTLPQPNQERLPSNSAWSDDEEEEQPDVKFSLDNNEEEESDEEKLDKRLNTTTSASTMRNASQQKKQSVPPAPALAPAPAPAPAPQPVSKPPAQIVAWKELGLDPEVEEGVNLLGWDRMMPVQQQVRKGFVLISARHQTSSKQASDRAHDSTDKRAHYDEVVLVVIVV